MINFPALPFSSDHKTSTKHSDLPSPQTGFISKQTMSSIRSFDHFRPGQIAAQHRFYTQRSRQSTCSWVHDVALIHSQDLASGTSNHKADWSVYFILFMESDTCPLGSQRAQQSNQGELTSVYCPLRKRKSSICDVNQSQSKHCMYVIFFVMTWNVPCMMTFG